MLQRQMCLKHPHVLNHPMVGHPEESELETFLTIVLLGEASAVISGEYVPLAYQALCPSFCPLIALSSSKVLHRAWFSDFTFMRSLHWKQGPKGTDPCKPTVFQTHV